MTRKKGEEQQQQPQENLSSQTTRSSKEKGNKVASATAAAAKLEKFAYAPSQSPVRGNQLPPEKTQLGGTGNRKSLGKTTATSSTNIRTANKKSPEKDILRKATEVTADLSIVSEPEPTLKDVLCAVNSCRRSLSDLCE